MPAISYVAPAETTAVVPGTTAGLYTFATPVSRLFLNNLTGGMAYLRLNSSTAPSTASFDLALGPSEAPRLLTADDLGGAVSLVGVWLETGTAAADFVMRGA